MKYKIFLTFFNLVKLVTQRNKFVLNTASSQKLTITFALLFAKFFAKFQITHNPFYLKVKFGILIASP